MLPLLVGSTLYSSGGDRGGVAWIPHPVNENAPFLEYSPLNLAQKGHVRRLKDGASMAEFTA